MRIKLLLLSCFLPLSLWGQFGISLSYDQQNATDWERLISATDTLGALDQFGTVSFYYWWRPENLRIEVLPEIAYRRNLGKVPDQPLAARTHGIDFNLNADIYLFDLEGDCDCPTFSKDGNFFTKGFFLELSPGVSYRTYQIESTFQGELQGNLMKSNGFLGKLGVGAGLDIGISDLFTITPWFKNEWHLGANWENLGTWARPPNPELEKSTLSYMRFGLRLGFRPDYRPFR
jgi:hypothetical protein